MKKAILTLTALATAVAAPRAAHACGCFAQSNPAVPVIQAGERIVFAQDGAELEMHVQIQYDGQAEEFGWLLPVPEVPELSAGSDDLFATLVATTQPIYALTRNFDFSACRDFGNGNGNGSVPSAGDGSADLGAGAVDMGGGDDSPLVKREFVGPFDSAVLDASDKQAMLSWLEDNDYVVNDDPNDPVIDQYVGEGRYFVALKGVQRRR